jgi:hypothetical protein
MGYGTPWRTNHRSVRRAATSRRTGRGLFTGTG